MRHPSFTLLAAGAFVVATLPVQAAERVLSIGGSVTEIIYALGAGDKLVARDTTSSYPEPALDLPDVGYIRALAPEGVLSVNPDLIIAEAGAGPVETLDVLTQAEIPFVEVPDAYTGDGILAKIDAVGTAIERPDAARALRDKVAAELTEVAAKVASVRQDDRKRVLFILSTRGGRVMASGTGTAADGIIRMAGGTNALSEFEGYKLMTDEAISQAAPDVILMMDRGGDHGASNTELLSMPALVTTPAAKTGAVVRMNGLYLLGFGPRTAQAALTLAQSLYGAL
ncbi:heme/hemin ABC transporter substrate-binding protein [Tritonibacter horizontis]|uniref:Hemin-binding periplasmic protein HmuT n=1 Tax=Tritonibacter horizontis TaxID=1768241 RepID=A0A132BUA0_9RHOB|nr:ABC transporter substrate-binding protein [Tritonibacter horizontis]KUP91959.1 hemin-binding periplasmic protein HmuT precursor [Tritonibacter horizontis]